MQYEMTGNRDLSYSAWHRIRSIGRFVKNPDIAYRLSMIDIDNAIWVEAEYETKEPVALIETALDKDRRKCGVMLGNLARRAGVQAYIVLYTLADERNPEEPAYWDIVCFRVRRVYPQQEPIDCYHEMTPEQYAFWLVQLRQGLVKKLWAEWKR